MESFKQEVKTSSDESEPETPASLGALFNAESFDDFVETMRRKSEECPSARFEVVAD